MKTFFAVFFGILAAALVIWLAVYFNRRSELQARIEKVRETTLELSYACKGLKPGGQEKSDLEDQISKGEDVVRDLEYGSMNPADWEVHEAAFHNQILANGCFQPDIPPPSRKRGKN